MTKNTPADNISFTLPAGADERFHTAREIVVPTGWDNEATELLKTIHGSTLYGLNHADSDEDFYTVVPNRYIGRHVRRQSIVDGVDNLVIDFGSFMKMAEAGTPQALETMFSQECVSEYFEPLRQNYYASSSQVVHTYLRTMKAMALSDNESFKMRRHALRLAHNLEEIIYTGRFNPRLPEDVIAKISGYAALPFPEYIKELNAFTPLQVNWGASLDELV